uniref:Uncharacterized protein n=1 Tax=Octopus bimaculoides TaxID=37653 RepID=A0A0L8HY57_OCTBM
MLQTLLCFIVLLFLIHFLYHFDPLNFLLFLWHFYFNSYSATHFLSSSVLLSLTFLFPLQL